VTACVSVFRRRGRSFVQVFARSGYAWREVAAEALVAPLTPAELGAAVRSALRVSAAARRPPPWRRSATDGRLPQLAGVTTWMGFARGAVGVQVFEDDGVVRVHPMRRDGGTYVDLEEEVTTLRSVLDAVDDETLGSTVEAGLALST
jgi:hypothetical protein